MHRHAFLVLAAHVAAAQAARALPPRTDELAALSDEFTSAASLARWKEFHTAEGWPSMTRRMGVDSATGELRLEPGTSGWYADFHGPFLFREVTGDFQVTTRLRADGPDGQVPTTPWSLAGLMVRAPRDVTPATWTPGGEAWLFLTTGVAGAPSTPVFETKSTVSSRSALRLHPARGGWVELRIVRRGAEFELLTRYDGEEWEVRERFHRPDLPATVQVGINAYTDWNSASALHGDPFRFNTVPFQGGSPGLHLRVDWIRFARPEALGAAPSR